VFLELLHSISKKHLPSAVQQLLVTPFEHFLQNLVENGLARIFTGKMPRNALGDALVNAPVGALVGVLVNALETHIQVDENGQRTAPTLYTLLVSPLNRPILENRGDMLPTLSQALENYCLKTGVAIPEPITVALHADPNLDREAVQVVVHSMVSPPHEATVELPLSTAPATKAPRAFLILDQHEFFYLTRSPINIGRQEDNHLILDSPKVSRRHAQLRQVGEQFILFDLGSTRGTFINGQLIEQKVLTPGDVITFAGVSAVFGTETYPHLEQTQPLFKRET